MSRVPTQRVGELDQRVELQQFTRTPDGQGGFTETWAVVDTVWAQVRALRGSERNHGERLAAEGGYRVVIRYRDDVNATWRMRWVNRDRLMNIRFPEDNGGRDLYLVLECGSGVAS